MRPRYFILALQLALLSALPLLVGCASALLQTAPATGGQAQKEAASTQQRTNQERLDALWKSRTADARDFAIGPGDELQISVEGVQEINNLMVRVSGNGNIVLPWVGSVQVSGLTEPQATALIEDQLKKYMFNPQVDLLAKSDVSRLAAVMGAVRNPGVYKLDGPQDTVHTLIERAGGLTATATPEIDLTPGDPKRFATTLEEEQQRLGPDSGGLSKASLAAEPEHPVLPLPASGDTSKGDKGLDSGADPLVIALKGPDSGRYMALPVRPGDGLYVPDAGTVIVVGWVYRPGVIPITRKMTVLEAVSACGGPLFAADMTSVQIVRRSDDGPMQVIPVNLVNVQSAKDVDVPVRTDDIIQVPYSAARIPGYALYYAAQGLVSFLPVAGLAAGL